MAAVEIQKYRHFNPVCFRKRSESPNSRPNFPGKAKKKYVWNIGKIFSDFPHDLV